MGEDAGQERLLLCNLNISIFSCHIFLRPPNPLIWRLETAIIRHKFSALSTVIMTSPTSICRSDPAAKAWKSRPSVGNHATWLSRAYLGHLWLSHHNPSRFPGISDIFKQGKGDGHDTQQCRSWHHHSAGS